MDINEKVDKIITLLGEVLERLDESDEKYEELREAVINLGSGGPGYSIFNADDDNQVNNGSHGVIKAA